MPRSTRGEMLTQNSIWFPVNNKKCLHDETNGFSYPFKKRFQRNNLRMATKLLHCSRPFKTLPSDFFQFSFSKIKDKGRNPKTQQWCLILDPCVIWQPTASLWEEGRERGQFDRERLGMEGSLFYCDSRMWNSYDTTDSRIQNNVFFFDRKVLDKNAWYGPETVQGTRRRCV